MDTLHLKSLLTALASGTATLDETLSALKDLPFQDLDFVSIDHHRALRTGMPEVIFCQGKTPEHVAAIVTAQLAHGATVFGTRASEEVVARVKQNIPTIEHDSSARCFWHKSPTWQPKSSAKPVIICTAGTADFPVAHEALRTFEINGYTPEFISDIGIAGLHRILHHRERLQSAAVIVAVAGMEGALPSVLTGLVSCPVIGVPTSIGYGAHMNGLVPLMAMINSCASGMTVVNIDNGFGAACAAVRMISA